LKHEILTCDLGQDTQTLCACIGYLYDLSTCVKRKLKDIQVRSESDISRFCCNKNLW